MKPGIRFEALVAHPSVGSHWLINARLRDGYVVGVAHEPIMWGGGEGLYYEERLENWPLSCVRQWRKFEVPA